MPGPGPVSGESLSVSILPQYIIDGATSTIAEVGPVSTTYVNYRMDSFSKTQWVISNLRPPESTTVMDRGSFMLHYTIDIRQRGLKCTAADTAIQDITGLPTQITDMLLFPFTLPVSWKQLMPEPMYTSSHVFADQSTLRIANITSQGPAGLDPQTQLPLPGYGDLTGGSVGNLGNGLISADGYARAVDPPTVYSITSGGFDIQNSRNALASACLHSAFFATMLAAQAANDDGTKLATQQIQNTGNRFICQSDVNSSLRPFPIQSICTSLIATINGAPSTTNIATLMPYLLSTLPDDEITRWTNETPSSSVGYIGGFPRSGLFGTRQLEGASHGPSGLFGKCIVGLEYRRIKRVCQDEYSHGEAGRQLPLGGGLDSCTISVSNAVPLAVLNGTTPWPANSMWTGGSLAAATSCNNGVRHFIEAHEPFLLSPFMPNTNTRGVMGLTLIDNMSWSLTLSDAENAIFTTSTIVCGGSWGDGGLAGDGSEFGVITANSLVYHNELELPRTAGKGGMYPWDARPGFLSENISVSILPVHLRIKYVTLPAILVSRLPPQVTYPWDNFLIYSEGFAKGLKRMDPVFAVDIGSQLGWIGATAPTFKSYGEVITFPKKVELQSYRLARLPDKIVLMVKPSNKSAATGDTCFLPIISIAVQLLNDAGKLITFSSRDLWNLSAANGIKQTYSEGRDRGFPLVLSVANDLGLPEGVFANAQYVNTMLTISITVGNGPLLGHRWIPPMDWEVVTAMIFHDQVSFAPLTGSYSVNPTTATDIAKTMADGQSVTLKPVEGAGLGTRGGDAPFGGGGWSNFWTKKVPEWGRGALQKVRDPMLDFMRSSFGKAAEGVSSHLGKHGVSVDPTQVSNFGHNLASRALAKGYKSMGVPDGDGGGAMSGGADDIISGGGGHRHKHRRHHRK